MKKIAFSTVAALCLMAISTSASAASKMFVFGEYAQLTYDKESASYTTGAPSSMAFIPAVDSIDEVKNSFVIGAGYKMSDQLSVIAGYGDFGTYDASVSSVLIATSTYSQNYQTVNTGIVGGVRLNIKVGKKLGVYGDVGMVYTTEEITFTATKVGESAVTYRNETVNNTKVFFGAGGVYKMKNGLEAYAFYKRYAFEVSNADAIGGGISFAFK